MLRDEPANELKSANETALFFEILWRRHLEHLIHFYPPDNKAEEHSGRYTDLWMNLELVF